MVLGLVKAERAALDPVASEDYHVPISWRPAILDDVAACLALQPERRGDGATGAVDALTIWTFLLKQPFFLSAVLEADPPIQGLRLVGFGSAILVSSEFMDAEVASPRPNVTARINADHSVLVSKEEVARMNAGRGIEVVILHSTWRDDILSASENANCRHSWFLAWQRCLQASD